MATTDTTLLKNDHRRRRWMIRICLVSLLVLLMFTVFGLIMFDFSKNDLEQAKANYTHLNDKSTLSEVESLLGKAHVVNHQNGNNVFMWQFTKESLTQIEFFFIDSYWDDDGKAHIGTGVGVCEGWNLWNIRWQRLKDKLGIK